MWQVIYISHVVQISTPAVVCNKYPRYLIAFYVYSRPVGASCYSCYRTSDFYVFTRYIVKTDTAETL
jgi:hypothetical protein